MSDVTTEKKSTLKPIKQYFGMKPDQKMTEFAVEYKALTEQDKVQLADGIEDSSLNY